MTDQWPRDRIHVYESDAGWTAALERWHEDDTFDILAFADGDTREDAETALRRLPEYVNG